ncbi:MAG: hypothetical protein QNK03_23940 [Myxococcota bacterium]|nr:hypothetical protein [Myxococcota bacterium]
MRTTLLGLAAPAFLACATPQSVRFDTVPPGPPADAHPNRRHPPLVSLEELREIDTARAEVLSEEDAGAGVTGARKVEIRLPSFDEDLELKVKQVPGRLDGWNNSPRKELAAFKVQQLFLDPVDFVVPTTAVQCLPLDRARKLVGSTSPSIEGTNCVLVTIAMWLQDVTLPDLLYDEERFLSEPRYAYNFANFNVLTHLIAHRDNRTGNFLVSKDDEDRRVYAIDNGSTFGAWFFNWFFPWTYRWHDLRVPALPRQTVERLRALSREDLDVLAVVSQLEADEAGMLRVSAPTVPIDPGEGVRVDGTTVQFGLTTDEIDDVWERIEELLEDVDEGDLAIF